MTAHRRDERRIQIIQGDYVVVDNPDMVVATLLGSCVAACLRDPVAGIGGMNHFLVPDDREDESYGVHLMELLVNGLMRRGARRERLEAKLFGGARMMLGLSDVGARNAEFAHRFLKNEGIRFAGGSLGGAQGRRIQFWPVSGRARQSFIQDNPAPRPILPSAPAMSGAGELELF